MTLILIFMSDFIADFILECSGQDGGFSSLASFEKAADVIILQLKNRRKPFRLKRDAEWGSSDRIADNHCLDVEDGLNRIRRDNVGRLAYGGNFTVL